jgi:hypothetical protein
MSDAIVMASHSVPRPARRPAYYIFYSRYSIKWSQWICVACAIPATRPTAGRRICAAEMRHLPGKTELRRGRITKGGSTHV